MKVAIIGSYAYKNRMDEHKKKLDEKGNYVLLPAFDDFPYYNELDVCVHNKESIEWADEVHIFWDQRSMGTVFDFGMCFALNKKIKIIYMEPKTLRGVMEKYEELRNNQ